MQPDVTSLLLEAGMLLLVGMSVVFLFLTLLIGAVNVIAWASAKFPEDTPSASKNMHNRAAPATSQSGVPAPVVAAISAAVEQYRRQH
ncbi:OadG family protein [Paraglaciecola polaris]|uniref:Probable oxaloacetate decarboxylase gamma chain n=1 Tax=Paraglaciecola polaris LMG 21857 TaxID=1129793 RepID=K6ZX88_9ALTE|nr:OadG family transporter subunit [Paraglaciecola polaris]GAC33358.1 oxaloacetate decarboxylase, gamma subunit [Paraglaciecola polaris LMG 21857]|tara:strand:- start:1087 stop:1350 length:264 start_codon:yes stop_codon:yes gene_type:complete